MSPELSSSTQQRGMPAAGPRRYSGRSLKSSDGGRTILLFQIRCVLSFALSIGRHLKGIDTPQAGYDFAS